jgi:hypothetical protein
VSEEARIGKRIVVGLALALLIPKVVVFAVAIAFALPLGQYAIRLGIGLLIAAVMWRGYSWARSYVALAFGLSSAFSLVGGFLIASEMPLLGLVGICLAPFYAWGAWVLWSSPKVEAYIAYCEQRRNPVMSLSTRDGA